MKHAVKKLGMMLLTMLIVSFLAFLAFQIIPGDPTNTILGTDATPEQVAALRAQLGLDRPFFVRYFDWLFSFICGDFGTSYSYSMPVSEMLAGKLGVTLLLAAAMVYPTIRFVQDMDLHKIGQNYSTFTEDTAETDLDPVSP